MKRIDQLIKLASQTILQNPAKTGMISRKGIKKGEKVGVAWVRVFNHNDPSSDFHPTKLGRLVVHSNQPNLIIKNENKDIIFVANKFIPPYTELTCDHNTFTWEGKREFAKSSSKPAPQKKLVKKSSKKPSSTSSKKAPVKKSLVKKSSKKSLIKKASLPAAALDDIIVAGIKLYGAEGANLSTYSAPKNRENRKSRVVNRLKNIINLSKKTSNEENPLPRSLYNRFDDTKTGD